MRALDGRLLRVEPVWTAEAERFDGEVAVASATSASQDTAWSALVEAIAAGRVTRLRRVHVAGT